MENLANPRSLPCLHTFCTKCLEGICKNKEPGYKVACPICREDFNIPVKGVSGLPRNFFVEGLADVQKPIEQSEEDEPCEVCSKESDGATSRIPSATVYCVDCSQKLCERCSTPHRQWKGGPHQMVTYDTEMKIESGKLLGSYCEQHTKKTIEFYCFDCKANICALCLDDLHQDHKIKGVDRVAEEFARQMDKDVDTVTSHIGELKKEAAQLETENNTVLEKTEITESMIKE
jgi:tripartite motif-containing protein 56